MIVTNINHPQALEHDFDAVVHVVPPGASFGHYNPCCTGSFYGTGCTADCADAIAWAAYSKAWAESVCGYELIDGKDPASDPMPRHDYNWLTGEPAASQAEIDAWWARRMEHPKLDWGDAPYNPHRPR